MSENIINQTKKWINNVVIGCNFCPFAAREMKRNSIHYLVELSTDPKTILKTTLAECDRLDVEENIATTFIILPNGFQDFYAYLDLVALVEEGIEESDNEGIYQLASFHPDFCFAESAADDPANFTNRSMYPMLHLLREESIDTALEKYQDPEGIPERNIALSRKKGLAQMKALREACF